MPLIQGLQQLLPSDYFALLQAADATGDFSAIEARLQTLAESDSHMQAVAEGEIGTKYYKPFVQATYPRIIPALRSAIQNGTWPEIDLTFDDAQAIRRQLGLGSLGSPQDFLYGFTSQRYKNWGPTLFGMGFQSACMTGQQQMKVCMAPRFLDLSNPTMVIPELAGAISTTFWQSTQAIFGTQTVGSILAPILQSISDSSLYSEIFQQTATGDYEVRKPAISAETAQFIAATLDAAMTNIPPLSQFYASTIRDKFASIAESIAEPKRRQKTLACLKEQLSGAAKAKQEQLALKYMEEGNYLQKLLLGAKVEHIQSNVKMVANPMRGNKCEVDSIYRVLEQRRIVLVEAKGAPQVSCGQLYQLYETYRLKLPSNWEVDVVSLFVDDPTPEEASEGVARCVGMALVTFNEQFFGNVTASLLAVKPQRYLRWQIRQV